MFGQFDEVAGRHRPALRVNPAQQGLERCHTAVGQADLRLVDQLELITPKRQRQVGAQCTLLHMPGRQAGIVQTPTIATAALDRMQRQIGRTHQAGQVLRILRHSRHADAPAQLDAVALHFAG